MAVLTAEPTKPACRRAYNVLQRRRRGETRPARQPRRGEESNDENDSTAPYNASDGFGCADAGATHGARRGRASFGDRKSTRLNSSHLVISYAVFCLKKQQTAVTSPQLPNSHTLHPSPTSRMRVW